MQVIKNTSTFDKTEEKFKLNNREWYNIQFYRLQMFNSNNGYEIHYENHISKLKELSKDATYTYFKSLRPTLSRTKHSRPEIACFVASLVEIQKNHI